MDAKFASHWTLLEYNHTDPKAAKAMSPLRGCAQSWRYRWLAPPAKLCRPCRGYCWPSQEQNRDPFQQSKRPAIAHVGRRLDLSPNGPSLRSRPGHPGARGVSGAGQRAVGGLEAIAAVQLGLVESRVGAG